MIPEFKRNLASLYKIYRNEGIITAAQSILHWLSNRANNVLSELHPKTLFGRLINSTKSSTSIWEQEWDICLILDGCRTDTFESVFDGESSRIRSVASTSQTWIPRTFNDKDTSKVAYVTANPFAANLDPHNFAYFHLEPVQQTKYGIETVPPEPLADRAIHIWRKKEQLDIDRLIVHFMQPHAPFRKKPSLFDEFLGTETWGSKVWQRIESDEINREDFFEAYRDNLRWVFEKGVNPIKQNCDATIALTADHGNAAGKWGYYGHPRHAPIPSVRIVPWATIEGVDKGIKTPSITDEKQTIDVDKQLSALGYK